MYNLDACKLELLFCPRVEFFQVLQTATEERKRAGLAGQKYLNGLRFKSAERRK
jgi:hypothetical protein